MNGVAIIKTNNKIEVKEKKKYMFVLGEVR